MVTSFCLYRRKRNEGTIKSGTSFRQLFTDEGEVQAVRDVSFSLNAGEVLAVVGESGCGKVCSAKAL